LAPPSVYEWVNVRQYCKELWIKARYKCNLFTILVIRFNGFCRCRVLVIGRELKIKMCYKPTEHVVIQTINILYS